MPVMLEPFGDAGLRARLPESFDARAVLAALRGLPEIIDVVVTERHALVTFDPNGAPPRIEETLSEVLRSPAAAIAAPASHRIAVRYDGEDLDEVAVLTALSRSEVIARHAAGDYVVGVIGFLPGFAYLRGLDERLVVPRRPAPRPRVAARSVALGGPYTGVYPFASPGGWHLIGTAVDFWPFDPHTGARLALGDRVTFVACER